VFSISERHPGRVAQSVERMAFNHEVQGLGQNIFEQQNNKKFFC
jgi:hypothetical protein